MIGEEFLRAALYVRGRVDDGEQAEEPRPTTTSIGSRADGRKYRSVRDEGEGARRP